MILMPGMSYRSAQAAADRFATSLETQMKDRAPEARFEIKIQPIYQHDRREADNERDGA